jgi:WD40 repeat protein
MTDTQTHREENPGGRSRAGLAGGPRWPAKSVWTTLGLLLLFLSILGGGPPSARAQPPEPRLVASLRGETGKPDEPIPAVHQVQFSADGRTLAADADGVTLWEVATWQVRAAARPPDPKQHPEFALAPDGRTLAALAEGLPLRAWDLPAGTSRRLPARATSVSWLSCLAFSPNGQHLAVKSGVSERSPVTLVEAATGKELASLQAEDFVYALAFSPDGKTLAVADCSARSPPGAVAVVRLWDVPGGRQRSTLGPCATIIRSMAFSPDGKALAAVGDGEMVRVWDVATGRVRASWKAELYGPRHVVFSPDGRVVVATGGGLAEVKFWEAATGKELLTLRAHHEATHSVALSPDGRLLAAACWEKTVNVWDVSAVTGRPVPDLPPARDGERTGSAAQPPDQAGKLTGEELERLWSQLAGGDAQRAYRAVWALAEAPRQAVPFLAKELKPDALPDPKRTAQLLADLDSNDFAVRQKAAEELQGLGELAELALRRELEKPGSAEVRQRVEKLLEKLRETPPPAERLRGFRAVEALEHAGTPEARRLLRALAEGAPEARLTQEARFALERLARRPTATP